MRYPGKGSAPRTRLYLSSDIQQFLVKCHQPSSNLSLLFLHSLLPSSVAIYYCICYLNIDVGIGIGIRIGNGNGVCRMASVTPSITLSRCPIALCCLKNCSFPIVIAVIVLVVVERILIGSKIYQIDSKE